MNLLGLANADYGVLAVYLVVMVLVGMFFSRRQNSSSEFFLAGRSMGWFPIGISVMATLLSALSYSGVPGESYYVGFHYLLLPVMVWLCIPLMLKVVLPLYHNLEMYSVYEYLELRFDSRTRVVSSMVFVVWRLLWLGAVLYAPCKVLIIAAGIQIPEWILLLTLGLISTLYTFLGGMRAVIWTDVVQSMVMVGGIVLILLGAWSAMDGGLSTVIGMAVEHDRASVLETQFNWQERWSTWGMAPHLLISMLSFYVADQITVQRFLTAKSLKESKRSFLLNCLSVSIMIPALALVGVSLFAYYQTHPAEMRPIWVANTAEMEGEPLLDWYQDGRLMDRGTFDEEAVRKMIAEGKILRPNTGEPMEDPERVEQLLSGGNGQLNVKMLARRDVNREWLVHRKAQDEFMPRFLTDQLPVGIAGLILAALFAASMSSMDSGLNSISMLVITDFHRRWGFGRAWLARKKGKAVEDLNEEDEIILARPLVLLIGVLATLFSLTYRHIESIFDIMIAIVNTFGGPLFAIFMLGMFTRLATGRSALLALVAGTSFTLWMMAANTYESLSYLWPWEQTISGVWPLIFGFGFTVIVGLVGGMLLGGRKSRSELRGLVVGLGPLGDRGPVEASRAVTIAVPEPADEAESGLPEE